VAGSLPLAVLTLSLSGVLTGCGHLESAADPLSASSLCALHLDDVREAEFGTVGGVRSFGPRVIDPPPDLLDGYADDEPIVLCLVPDDAFGYAAVAVVLVDGATAVRWTQNVDHGLVPPS